MKKQEFLRALKKKIRALSTQEIAERLIFYSEMIDDRIEEGLTEEEAVDAVGDIQTIANQIMEEASEANSNGNIRHNKKLKAWEFVLLIVGSPLWLPILITVFAVLWSLIITLWATSPRPEGALPSGAAARGILTGKRYMATTAQAAARKVEIM